MNSDELRAKLTRDAERAERIPTIAQALITDRGLLYALYRMRYAGPRSLLRTVLHAIEVIAIAGFFPLEYVTPILAIRGATALVTAGFWGALEPLRERVREQAQRKQWTQARQTIERWLSYAIDFALLELAVLVVWLVWGPFGLSDLNLSGFSVFDAFAIAATVRLMLETVARTYHSGVFALRRVYRSFWSVFGPDLFEVGALLILLPVLGLWSLSIVLLLGGILRLLLLLRYTTLAYRGTRLPRPTLRNLTRARMKRERFPLLDSLKHAAANLSSRIDSALVLALLYGTGQASLSLALVFHLLGPLMAAAQRWAGLFYFDFQQVKTRYSAFFQRRFERLLLKVALLFASIVSAIVLGLTLLFQLLPLGTALLLIPFLLLRSIIALYQVQSFSYHQGAYLLKFTLALFAVIGITVVGFESETSRLGCLSGLTLLVLLWLPPPPLSARRSLAEHARVGFFEWIRMLRRTQGPVWLGFGVVDADLGVSRRRLIDALMRVLPSGALCTLGRRQLLWFCSGKLEHGQRQALVLATGGCLRRLECVSFSDAAPALELLCTRLEASGHSGAEAIEGDLDQAFRRNFENGQILRPRNGRLRARHLTKQALRAVIHAVEHTEAQGSAGKRTGAFDVTVYAPRGYPERVFVVSKAEAANERKVWRRRLFARSLKDAIHGPTAPPEHA